MDNTGKTATYENIKIGETIVNQGLLRNIIRQVTNNSSDIDLLDLEQDLLYSLLLDTKLPGIFERGELNYYLARLVMNNIASKTSPYYRIYKRPLNNKMPLSKSLIDSIDGKFWFGGDNTPIINK